MRKGGYYVFVVKVFVNLLCVDAETFFCIIPAQGCRRWGSP